MKKLLKTCLLAGMLALSVMNVSAATYVPTTATINKEGTSVTIELPVGTEYKVGTNELLARAGVVCPSPGIPGNVASQGSLPFYVLGSFDLTSAEVTSLKTKSIYKTVSAKFDPGCSELKVMTGTGNAPQYTGGTTNPIPTNPTTPSTGDERLAPYSARNLPIYENSRVTWVSQSGSTIKISGYMLEQFKNYNKKDSYWREMVFISEDWSRAYRYNLNSSAVYNPYLNSNKTLNPNGQYNYSYAFYNATINLNNVQEYWTKTPTSLPSGNYRVYIRMSDGKRSNVMSLRNTKDEVVLPSSFYLIPGTTDVGFRR